MKVPANDTGDDFVDSPTNYGEDTGKGGEVRGNYCTMHPLTNQDFGYGKFYLKEGNLLVGTTNGSDTRLGATIGASSGKWYWEMEFIGPAGSGGIGINKEPNDYHATWNGTGDAVIYQTSGDKHINGTGSAYGASYANNVGDVMGVQWDADNGQIWFWEQGVLQNSGTAARTGMSGFYTPVTVCTSSGSAVAYRMNFGQRPFKYQNAGTNRPSTDYKCLCSTNLPDTFAGEEDVVNNPSKFFDTILRTGFGSDGGSVTGLAFQPDFIWEKVRNISGSNNLFDAIRGPSKFLQSDTNAADGTAATYLTSFDTNGFSMGAADYSTNDTLVNWCWDAGTAAATASTDGSITPSAQWVNATAGFSISKYTGTGANATIGHGLSAVPEFVLIKALTHTSNWAVYHKGFGNTHTKKLNDYATSFDNDAYWNDTTPTNTVVSIGNNYDLNQSNAHEYIMYAWTPIPGYSAFEQYVGNNDADGTYLNFGFYPQWIMVTRHGSNGWMIMDSIRETYNPKIRVLYAHDPSAEFDSSTGYTGDFVSNGFKFRSTGQNTADTFIVAAFAKNPFKLARAH